MWPYASGEYVTLDAHHNIYIHCAHAEQRVTEGATSMCTVKNEAELVLADHGTDCHSTGIDHAGHRFARDRLAHHRKHASPPPVDAHRRAWTGHVDSWTEATSVDLELDSVHGFWWNLFVGRARHRAVSAHGGRALGSLRERRKVFLRQVLLPLDPAL